MREICELPDVVDDDDLLGDVLELRHDLGLVGVDGHRRLVNHQLDQLVGLVDPEVDRRLRPVVGAARLLRDEKMIES